MSATNVSGPPPDVPPQAVIQGRVRALEAERDAAAEPGRKSALEHEIGALTERATGDVEQAAAHYLRAHELDPGFSPSVFALARVLQPEANARTLENVHAGLAAAQTDPARRASARVSQAALAYRRAEARDDALALLEQALAEDPEQLAAALLLEHHHLAAARRDDAERVIAHRAERTRQPALHAQLVLELAGHREARFDAGTAIAWLKFACELPGVRFRMLLELQSLARRHGRVDVLVDALESHAQALLGAAGRPRDEDFAHLYSPQPIEDDAQLRQHAAALWRQAARVRLWHYDDVDGAQMAYAAALAQQPDDVLLLQEHMALCERIGDLGGASASARAMLAQAPDPPAACALHFHLAEHARSQHDWEGSRAALAEAVAADPTSITPGALLEDAHLDAGDYAALTRMLEERAGAASGAVRAQLLWRAAELSASRMGDAARAKALLDRATPECPDKRPILREIYGLGLRFGEPAWAETAAAVLCALQVPDTEKSALFRERYGLMLGSGDAAAIDGLLRSAVEVSACRDWAPDAARLLGVWHGDFELLARAHRAMAERAGDDETFVAHLCAAARAAYRGNDREGAVASLQQALSRAPSNAYAVTLLEELLLDRGDSAQALELLRAAAEAEVGERSRQLALLRAGQLAEAAGERDEAARAYLQAIELAPQALGPLWALRRLAERTGDAELRATALEGLARRERALDAPGWSLVELGELLQDLGRTEEAASALAGALDGPDVALAAAADLVTLPIASVDAPLRARALSLLEHGAGEAWQRAFARERGACDPAALASLVPRQPDSPSVQLARIFGAEHAGERAGALFELSRLSADSGTSALLLLHSVRTRLFESDEDDDTEVLLAVERAGNALPAAIAVEEALFPADDAESHVAALGTLDEQTPEEDVHALRAAWARALLSSGQHTEALGIARQLLERDEDDLLAWELCRVAARASGEWALLARACDQLAAASDGTQRARLAEEAGLVWADHLHDTAEAKRRFETTLGCEASRALAFDRLHDILADEQRYDELLSLLQARIEAIDDGDEIVDLRHEQARLLRALGRPERALAALEHLLSLQPRHLDGLGLKADLHTLLGQWTQAIDSLRLLAEADVAPPQVRLSHMRAAELLEQQLDDKPGALDELQRLVRGGLADATVYTRMGELSLVCSNYERAVQSFELAARHSSGAVLAALERRIGDICNDFLQDPARARDAYRHALVAHPTDIEACAALMSMLHQPQQRAPVLEAFERALRAELDPTDAESLRKLHALATYKADGMLELAALEALSTVGGAEPAERDAHRRSLPNARSLPLSLPPVDVDALRSPLEDAALRELGAHVSEALLALEEPTPASHGLGRDQRRGRRERDTVRDEIEGIVSCFGLVVSDYYVGGPRPDAVGVIAESGTKHAWYAGDEVGPRLTPEQRFEVAERAMALRSGSYAMLGRGRSEALSVVAAALVAVEAPLSDFPLGEAERALAERLGRAMPRRTRRGLAAAGKRPLDRARVGDFCLGARLSQLQAGMTLSRSLAGGLRALLGDDQDPRQLDETPAARALLEFWLSERHLAVQRALEAGS